VNIIGALPGNLVDVNASNADFRLSGVSCDLNLSETVIVGVESR
jgi:hypothetical protein